MSAISRTAAVLLAGVSLAACSSHSDTPAAGADTTALGAPAGSTGQIKDSAVAAGTQRIDSLHRAGVGPKNGIDSTLSRAQEATRNDPSRDTSHLNNRATPGAGPAAPAGTPPGATRP